MVRDGAWQEIGVQSDIGAQKEMRGHGQKSGEHGQRRRGRIRNRETWSYNKGTERDEGTVIDGDMVINRKHQLRMKGTVSN